MDAIFTYLSENYPTIGLMLVVAVIVYLVTMYHVSIQHARKKVDAMPCDSHTDKLNKISVLLIEICDALNRKKMIDPISVLKKFIPYSLTDAGKKFLEISGGKSCIDLNLDFFISELEKTNPQTAYDAEVNSRRVLILNAENPAFKGIKDYVFLTPDTIKIDNEGVDVSLITVITAMSIYLRDKYFEKYPKLLPNGLHGKQASTE
jgi:hypothetical protein